MLDQVKEDIALTNALLDRLHLAKKKAEKLQLLDDVVAHLRQITNNVHTLITPQMGDVPETHEDWNRFADFAKVRGIIGTWSKVDWFDYWQAYLMGIEVGLEKQGRRRLNRKHGPHTDRIR